MPSEMMFSSRLSCRKRTFGIILILLYPLSHVQADNKVPSHLEDEGTVHENLGQVHFPKVIYDDYVSKAHFSNPRTFPALGMDSVYNFTHTLLDFFHPQNGSYMLPDYVVHTNKSAFNMGNKYEENDWVDLLRNNEMLIIFWLLPLSFLAIIMPFIGVIYCCFCCWRCKNNCPRCNKSDFRRLLCSILLFLFIVGLLLAFILALLSLKQMNRNYGFTKNRLRDASRDTCTFLADVSLHLRHLMVDNFQKLSDHIDEQLSNAHSHVALDLADTSGAFALIELEKILKNMEPALRQLKILDNNEKLLRFIGSIHRDCWRGIKRDLVFFMVTLCQLDKCINEMRRYMRLDTSHCLHVDDMPNTTVFVEAMEGAIDGHLIDVVSKAIQRFNMIQDLIRKAIEPIKPPLSLILRRAASNLHDEYAYLNDLIDAVISDIHLRNMRSADTFDDINERFGTNRLTFDSIACALLFLILFASILGLCFGLCSRKSRAGSKFLIFAIILILCAFTFITLMGLFYFVLGMVTYQSVCRRLGELGDYESKSMRPVDRLGACKPDQHMYDFLVEYKLYDVERILYEDNNGPIDVDDVRWIPWDGDLSKFKILTMEEVELINKTLFDAYRYNGKLYTDNVCKDLRTPSKSIASDWYRFLYNNLYVMDIGCLEFQAVCTSVNSLMIDARNAQKLEPEILRCIDAITELTTKLDALLLGKKFNFGATITHLFDKILQSEEFIKASGKQYINTLGRNLTESLKTRINEYRLYTQSRIQNGVGPCGPLIYHLDRGTKSACRQLIDPINGFWMGLLMSSLIYLPLLFVAHYLICLYRPYKVKWPVVYLVRNDGCPTCTGHPYVPPPVVICTGGQENDWDSIDIDTVERKSKDD